MGSEVREGGLGIADRGEDFDWRNVFSDRSLGLFASAFDLVPIHFFLCYFRNRSLGSLFPDLLLHVLQRTLYLSYHIPPNVANFFITVALYRVELLEEAVQSMLVGAHRGIVRGDRELGVIKIENGWKLKCGLESGELTAHGADGNQRRSGLRDNSRIGGGCGATSGGSRAARERRLCDPDLHVSVSHRIDEAEIS